MVKRAGLLPTGEPREKSVPLRLNDSQWLLLEIASSERGMKLSTYIAFVALMQACDDMKGSAKHKELVAKIKDTVKVAM